MEACGRAGGHVISRQGELAVGRVQEGRERRRSDLATRYPEVAGHRGVVLLQVSRTNSLKTTTRPGYYPGRVCLSAVGFPRYGFLNSTSSIFIDEVTAPVVFVSIFTSVPGTSSDIHILPSL